MKSPLIFVILIMGGLFYWANQSGKNAAETAHQETVANIDKFDTTVDRVAARKRLPELRERVGTLREQLRAANTPGEAALLTKDLTDAEEAVEEAELEATR